MGSRAVAPGHPLCSIEPACDGTGRSGGSAPPDLSSCRDSEDAGGVQAGGMAEPRGAGRALEEGLLVAVEGCPSNLLCISTYFTFTMAACWQTMEAVAFVPANGCRTGCFISGSSWSLLHWGRQALGCGELSARQGGQVVLCCQAGCPGDIPLEGGSLESPGSKEVTSQAVCTQRSLFSPALKSMGPVFPAYMVKEEKIFSASLILI